MIPFVGSSHPLPLDRVDLQRSINLYEVQAEDAGEKSEHHLAPTPGLTEFGTSSLAQLSINDASGGAIDGATFTLTVTRSVRTDNAVTVRWDATGDTFAAGEGFKRGDDVYTGLLAFAAGETSKTITFTLEVIATTTFSAAVALSTPSTGSTIVDGTGLLRAVPETWTPVLRDHMFRYSLVDNMSIADPSFDETTLTLAQGTFGDVNPHPVNGVAWPVNTITPPPTTGDVIWVRKTTVLADFISTWHVHIVNDNTVRIWFNGVEKFGVLGGGGYDTTLDVTPVLGANVLVIRVVETLAGTPTNHSHAGFEITR